MREKALDNLRITCEGVKAEHGTIRTHGIDYDYDIRREITKCDRLGITRVEIQKVLCEFTNEILVKLPKLRRSNDKS